MKPPRKPSPEEIARKMIEEKHLREIYDAVKYNPQHISWPAMRKVISILITEALRAEKQRTMPSREEFNKFISKAYGYLPFNKASNHYKLEAAWEVFDWIESRMNK